MEMNRLIKASVWGILFWWCGLAFADSNNTQQMLEQVKSLQNDGAKNGSNSGTSMDSQTLLPNMNTHQSTTSNSAPALTSQPNSANPPAPPAQVFKAPFESDSQSNTNPISQSISQTAFSNTVQGILPMTPEQIHRLRQLYSASQYAAAAPAGIPPKPTATSLMVDLSPGAASPAVNLAEGDITALVFLDSTGAPWPVEAIDNGNPNAFDIQWNKKDNVLLVQATTAFGRGNLAVRLRQLGPPVMLTLVTNNSVDGNGGVVDYRVDLRIPGLGPNALPVQNNNTPNPANPVLLDVLDGLPPDGAKALDVSNDAGQAWLKGDSLFLRTRLTLLSPAWLAAMSSADGTNAYQLQKSPLLLMSQNGKVVQIKLKGF